MALLLAKILVRYKSHLKLDWHKGYLFVAYFLVLVIIDFLTKGDWAFTILAWPLYLIPQRLIASIVQVLFVYCIVVVLDVSFFQTKKKKKKAHH